MAKFLLLLSSRFAAVVKAYFSRVGGDGGTTVNKQHAQEVYTDTNDYNPTLIQSCDSGKATVAYSLFAFDDVDDFELRVVADGGTNESTRQNALVAQHLWRNDLHNNASIVVPCASHKAGRLYAYQPTVEPDTTLLDYYTGSAAAYSLRSLSASTTNVVKVRRSGDDAELDFTATEVSDGTLAAWVTAGGGTENGFVTTWYDQSGNTNNATQATAANQPKIVSAGSLVTENGKAAMEFDGSNDYFQSSITGFQNITNLSTFSVITPTDSAASDTATMTIWSFGDFTGNRILGVASATGLISTERITIFFEDATARRLGSSTYSRSANEQSLISSNHLQSGTTFFAQGSQVTLDLVNSMTTSTSASPSDTGYTTNDNVYIGALYQSGPITLEEQRLQEVIFYSSDQSAKRTGIEANINDYYNIYS